MIQHLTSLSILFTALALIASFAWDNAKRHQRSERPWKILFRVLMILALICNLAANRQGV